MYSILTILIIPNNNNSQVPFQYRITKAPVITMYNTISLPTSSSTTTSTIVNNNNNRTTTDNGINITQRINNNNEYTTIPSPTITIVSTTASGQIE
jgi:hypothetical protein